MSIEDRLQHWRQAEKAAMDAEHAVARLGQAAADQRAGDLFLKAKMLRQQADREFGLVLRDINPDATERDLQQDAIGIAKKLSG